LYGPPVKSPEKGIRKAFSVGKVSLKLPPEERINLEGIRLPDFGSDPICHGRYWFNPLTGLTVAIPWMASKIAESPRGIKCNLVILLSCSCKEPMVMC
jgi:hypothetical protein